MSETPFISANRARKSIASNPPNNVRVKSSSQNNKSIKTTNVGSGEIPSNTTTQGLPSSQNPIGQTGNPPTAAAGPSNSQSSKQSNNTLHTNNVSSNANATSNATSNANATKTKGPPTFKEELSSKLAPATQALGEATSKVRESALGRLAEEKGGEALEEVKSWSTTTKILLVVFIVLVLVLIFFAFIYPKIQKNKLNKAESNPILISKKTEANKEHKVEAKQIKLSPGETQFSFNIWFYVFSDEFMNNRGNWKHIFHRGTEDPNGDDNNEGIQTPGLWLAPRRNQLWLVFTSKNRDRREKVLEGIPNIPMNRWNNININLYERNLEVYLNGELKVSKLLDFIPIIDGNPVYISKNKGFNGYISKFIYSNQALNTNKIKSITFKGP